MEKYFSFVKSNRSEDIHNKKFIRLVNRCNIEKSEMKTASMKNLNQNVKEEKKISDNKPKSFSRLNSLYRKSGDGAIVLKSFSKFPTNDNVNSNKIKNIRTSVEKMRIIGAESSQIREELKILAANIYSNDTLEKERKFKISEGKIFKSRNSLLKKFTYN